MLGKRPERQLSARPLTTLSLAALGHAVKAARAYEGHDYAHESAVGACAARLRKRGQEEGERTVLISELIFGYTYGDVCSYGSS